MGPNLLKNGDFARGGAAWNLERSAERANASLERLGSDSLPPGIRGRAIRAQILALGSRNVDIQFSQADLDLTEGSPYTLTFWARADRDRPLAVYATVNVGDGHGIGLAAEALRLTRDWQPFSLVFTAAGVADRKNRLTFVLGDALGSVDLASVSLRRGRDVPVGGPNLLRNGDLARASQDWKIESGAPGASAVAEWLDAGSAPPDVPGRAVRIRVDSLGTQNWHLQFTQTGLDLQEGEPYTIIFRARADRARPLGLNASLDMPDWHGVGLDQRVTLSPEWRKHVITFTATRIARNHVRVVFVLGDAPGTVELAGLSLKHTPATLARTRHPLVGMWETRGQDRSRSSRFTFNADGTGSLQVGRAVVRLGAAPREPVANPFRWYVQESDRLVVAEKTYRWKVAGAGNGEQLTLTPRNGKATVLFRIPMPP